MKQYFLLPFLCLFVIGCSLEIGNEYDERRLPVDNKTYLIKQKREKKSASQDTEIEGVPKRRYQFKDSERPQRRDIGYRGEYMHGHPIVDDEECEQYCDDNGCESSCHDTELVSDDSPEYYPDYDVRGEGVDDDYGMHDQSEKTGREAVVAHTPKGVYHEKQQAKSVKIKPLQNSYKKNNNKVNVSSTDKPKNLPHNIQKKSLPVKTPVIVSRKPDSPDVGYEDDEGIPTIPPKVSTRDNMQNLVQKNQRSPVKSPNTALDSTQANGIQPPLSTVKEANQNITNIQSQIESRNIQNKANLQSSSIDNQANTLAPPVTDDMNNKLSQLEELTSQEQTVQPFTPKFPANNQPQMEKFGTAQQKTSSQEVHLQLDSNSGNSKPPVGEPPRSDLPPPVDLSE
jgi:hypothetical protein